MKRFLAFIPFSVLLVCISHGLWAQTLQPSYQQYIAHYRAIAVEQQRLHGIPASITMAQGLLESAAGQSELALYANNHFGIKCTSDWQGAGYHHDDDELAECFRKYDHPEESWEDHSKFLMRPRYKQLFSIPVTNYQEWAYGLSACGYATDPNYPEKLIRIIRDYGLESLTADEPAEHQLSPSDSVMAADTSEIVVLSSFRERAEMESLPIYYDHKSGRENGNRYVLAERGESFQTLAIFFNMDERTLRRYNDATDGRELEPGDRVYLYKKPRRAARSNATYYVRKGDTAWSISQRFCFQMRTLYDLNGIPYGTPLVTRQELRLR